MGGCGRDAEDEDEDDVGGSGSVAVVFREESRVWRQDETDAGSRGFVLRRERCKIDDVDEMVG